MNVTLIIILMFHLLCETQSKSLVQNLVTNGASEYVKTAFREVLQVFFRNSGNLVLVSLNSYDLLEAIYKKYSISLEIPTEIVEVRAGCAFPSTIRRQFENEAYFLVVEDENVLLECSNITLEFWQNVHYRSKYMIFFRNKIENYIPYFKIMWENFRIHNLIIIEVLTYSVKMYSFNPISALHNSEESVTEETITSILSFSDRAAKRTRNLQDVPITISMKDDFGSYMYNDSGTVTFIGRDGDLLQTIIQRTNFFPEYRIVGYDESEIFHPNGSVSGCFRDLMDRSAEMSIRGFVLQSFKNYPVEIANSVIRFGKVCITVPKGDRIPNWMLVFKIISPSIWLGVLIVTVLSAVVLHRLRKKENSKSFENRNFSDFIVLVLQFFISYPVNKSYLLKALGIRWVAGACFLFSIVFTSIFQGGLVDTMTNPRFEKDISSLEELAQSKLLIEVVNPDFEDTFANTGMKLFDQLNKKIVHYDPISNMSAIDKIILFKDRAALAPDVYLKYTMGEIEDSKNIFFVFDKCPRMYMLSYVFPRGSPYFPLVNNITMRLYESGIMDKWYDENLVQQFGFGWDIPYSISQQPTPENLNDQLTAFLTLGLGCFIGFCIFLGEKIYYGKTRNFNAALKRPQIFKGESHNENCEFHFTKRECVHNSLNKDFTIHKYD